VAGCAVSAMIIGCVGEGQDHRMAYSRMERLRLMSGSAASTLVPREAHRELLRRSDAVPHDSRHVPLVALHAHHVIGSDHMRPEAVRHAQRVLVVTCRIEDVPVRRPWLGSGREHESYGIRLEVGASCPEPAIG
jgi:hypothetical protein